MTKYLTLLLILLPALLAATPDRGWRLSGYNYWNSPDTEIEQNSRTEYYYTFPYYTQLDSMQCSSLEPISNLWQPDFSQTYQYAYGTDKIIEKNTYNFDDVYTHIGKVIAEYDNQGRIVTETDYSVYASPDLTVPGYRYWYYYDDLGITEYDFKWRSTGGDYYKVVYQKDAQGRITSALNYWSSDSTNWSPGGRVFYTYHANDTSTGADYEEYLSHQLDNGLQFSSTSLIWQGMITERILQGYINNEWINDSRELLEYDTANHLTSLVKQGFDGSSWYSYRRYLFAYNSNGNLELISTQRYSNSEWSPTYETFNYAWEQYTSNDEDIQPPERLTIFAWPNPFRENVQIRLPDKSPFQLGIYNLKGQLVRSYRSDNTVCWDGKDSNDQPAGCGIYLIRATQNEQHYLQKVIMIR